MEKSEIRRICEKKAEDVTMVEYQAIKLEMFNKIGRTREGCVGVKCSKCCLDKSNTNVGISCTGFEMLHSLKAVRSIQNWFKENTLKTDWSKVKVDAKVLVWDYEGDEKFKRYFAKCENDTVHTWNMGNTSWSADDEDDVTVWNFAELVEDEADDNHI